MVRKTKEEASRTRQQIIDAAREVFHQRGVRGSTLEQVASAAGLTRGAVYWHFKDKAELFMAVREDVFFPVMERIDATLYSTEFTDPLDAIEASIREFFHFLDACGTLRQVFEVMVLRCEYVDEFAEVQTEVFKPAMEFLEKMENAYRRAAAAGTLRTGLDPLVAARDTWAFTSGVLHLLLGASGAYAFPTPVAEMVTAHMAMRRHVCCPAAAKAVAGNAG